MLLSIAGTLVLFTILASTGLTFLVMGWVAGSTDGVAIGAGFLVLTVMAFMRRLPWHIMLIALAVMIAGAGAADIWATLVTSDVALPAGIIGGAALGAVAGMVILGAVLPVGSEFVMTALAPRYPRLVNLVYFVPFTVRALLGAILLRQFMLITFGPRVAVMIGGGLFGLIAGIAISLILRQLRANTGQEGPATVDFR